MGNLVTRNEVEQHLNKTVGSANDLIDHIIPLASGLVEAFCNRVFASTEYIKLYDGQGDYELMLDEYPLISVSLLSQNIDRENSKYNSSIDSASMLLQKETGIIVLYNEFFNAGHKNVYIKYQSGYAEIPETIKSVTLDLISKKYYDIKEKRLGVTTRSVMGENVTFIFTDLSELNKKILSTFKKPPRLEGVTVDEYSASS